jgi:IMP cyclohydrolase
VFRVETLDAVLNRRTYPGRGLVAARTRSGTLFLGYFLTGRSAASRSREFTVQADGDVAVRDTSPSRAHDDLRHYVAAARRGGWTVVGNGDQVVPIADDLAAGADIEMAWARHTYEPDPPIFTSRIWLAIRTPADDCVLGFARRSERDDATDRVAWSVGALTPGSGVLMTTYDGTADQIIATRAPHDIRTESASAQELADEIWSALPKAVRVGAFVIDPEHPAGSLVEPRASQQALTDLGE